MRQLFFRGSLEGCQSDCPYFCGMIYLLEEKVLSLGTHLLCEPLLIDGTPEETVVNICPRLGAITGKIRRDA